MKMFNIHNNYMRIIAVMTATIMMLAIIAGCKNRDTDNGGSNNSSSADDTSYSPVFSGEYSEYTYIADYILLPDDIGMIRNLAYSDGRVFFSALKYEYNDNPKSMEDLLTLTTAELYSVNFDGTDLAPLPDYASPGNIQDDSCGVTAIDKMTTDAGGSLWLCESIFLSTPDFPDDFIVGIDDVIAEHYNRYDTRYIIRQLDNTGDELSLFDVSDICMNDEQQGYGINALTVSGDYIYLSVSNHDSMQDEISVFDKQGNLQCTLVSEDNFGRFVRLPDGTVAIQSGGSNILQVIDVQKGSVNETITISIGDAVYGDYYTAGDDADIIISSSQNVYSYIFGEETAELLFRWDEVGAEQLYISDIVAGTDNRIVCLHTLYDTIPQSCEIIVLTRATREELPDVTFLTLAGIYIMPEMQDAINEFNRTSQQYKIEIVDYNTYIDPNTYDWSGAISQMALDVTTGNVPDIIQTYGLMYEDFIDSGIFVDLYEFIDAEPDFERGDFVPSVLRAFEQDGGLYRISPSFYVNSMAGNPSVAGNGTGWNTEELKEVLDSHPGADLPFGGYMGKEQFLLASLRQGFGDYANRETGEVYFDSPQFVALLELANRFPDTSDFSISEKAMLEQGRQIAVGVSMSDFYLIQHYKSLLGGDIVFKGLPTQGKEGGSFFISRDVAIAASSPNKEGAWEFVRMLLDSEWQQRNLKLAFPTNLDAFNTMVKKALETDVEGLMYNDIMPLGYSSSVNFELVNPTQEDIDMIFELIDSVRGEYDVRMNAAPYSIIFEEAANYFSGVGTAEDAARVIQSRMEIWISERS